MYLIATDEAGYGPKLGPLVVVGTAWKVPDGALTMPADPRAPVPGYPQLPDNKVLNVHFRSLSQPLVVNGRRLVIDDSKRVYRRGDGLGMLHAIVTTGLHWCGNDERSYPALLSEICPDDVAAISRAPWLSPGETMPTEFMVPIDPEFAETAIAHWSASGIELVAVQARVITARRFNDAIASGRNKADLLSQSTLELVGKLVEQLSPIAIQTKVFCDRHGGRRYYAGPLQHEFDDWVLRVVSESKDLSRYQLLQNEKQLDVDFTVKGDQFPPVAFSSLVAKYLREQFMGSLNAFFESRMPNNVNLKPTAGYPVDADRFLEQIEEIREREGIQDHDFVRSR